MLLYFLLTAALGYLLGSIPTGYLVGRTRGIDVREHGSGNIGATNVTRVLGKKPGYFVFFCDALKGWLAVSAATFLVTRPGAASYILESIYVSRHVRGHGGIGAAELARFSQFIPVIGVVAALAGILGHNFPVWLRFRGGKGVATTVGTLLGLMPLAVLAVAGVWAVVFYTLRYVSLASILAATALPLVVWALGPRDGSLGGTLPMFCFSVAAAALVWWRHRGNIQRLLNGTEPRFARKA